MIIDTKFNVGDSVYLAEIYEIYWADKTPYVIDGIVVHSNGKKTVVVYNIKRDQLHFEVSEKFLFATYEECVRWCNEHN